MSTIISIIVLGLVGYGFYKIGRAMLPILLLGILLTFLFAVGGCVNAPTPYAELGMGYNVSLNNSTHTWEDGGAGPLGAAIEAGVTWDVKNNPDMQVDCRWLHLSQWSVGFPFNGRSESSVDHFGCSARYEFSE